MDILEKLREQGWYLTEEAIKKLPEDVDKSDTKKIIQAVMDMDLRGIGEGAIPSDISKKENSINGKRILQINKIRNISAPKSNEESKIAPRFLQLELTDGLNQINGLEFDNISSISLNTPPGTKLYLKSDRIQLIQGQLILNSNDIQILGGKVQNLIDKWEMARQLQKYTKNCLNRVVINGTSSGGPPPWIPFGQKIQQNIVGGNDKNFKSLGGNNGANTNSQNGDGKENKEKNEFDTMRNEAIAEAAKAGAKKVFGGGNQQLMDYNVKKIMEKGYTENEARNALKANRNNLEQALYNLKKRNSEEYRNKESSLGGSSGGGGGGGGGKRIGFKDSGKRSKNDELSIQTKPAANVSLFDFLTDKLPASATTVTYQDSSDKNISNKSERSKPFSHHDSVGSKSTSYHHSSQQQQHQHQQSSYNRQHQSSSSNTSHYQTSSTNSSHQQQQQKKDQQQQQTSQQQSQYQQNHANYNQTNRSKFENNLSSSFATRNTISGNTSEQQQQHDNYNKSRDINRQKESSSDRFKSNQRNNSSNYGQNQRPNDRYSSNYQKSGISSQSQSHQQRDHQQQQQQQQSQSQYEAKTSNIGSYDSRNRNDYQKRNGYDNNITKMSSSSTNNPSRYHHSKETSHPHAHSHQTNPRNYNENRQQQSNNTYDSGKMVNKLVEDTTKLKIDSISSTSSSSCIQQQQQQHQPHQQQQQNSKSQSNTSVVSHHQQQQQQQQHKSYQHHQQQQSSVPQQQASHMQQRLPSHSQHQQMQAQPQLQSQPQHHAITPHTATYAQTLPNGFTYDPNKIMGFQSKEANEFAMTLLKNQAAVATNTAMQPTPLPMASHHAAYPAPPPTIQIPPTAFTTPQFIMQPGPAGHPSIATAPYGISQCGAAGSGENWNWKIGDRCLAKYWDDGRYYEAEVTGVSDKTCVVLYLGYGNHEEVLKCDCLPLTDAQHRPLMSMTKLLHESQLQQSPAPTGLATNPLAAATAVPQPSIAAQAIVPPPGTIPAGVVSQHAAALNTRGLHASRYRGERQMYVPPPKRDN